MAIRIVFGCLGYHYIGVDIAPSAIAKARERTAGVRLLTDQGLRMVYPPGRVSRRAGNLHRFWQSAPAEAGRTLWMKEPDDEGVASHIGPESCVGVRKGVRRSVDRGTCRRSIESRKNRERCADAHSAAWKATLPRVAIARPVAGTAGSEASSMHGHVLRGAAPSPRGPGPRPGSREIPGVTAACAAARAVNPKGARRR